MSESPAIIAVFSPNGGRGGTFLATRLALELSNFGTTCLLDLDVEFGMCGSYLNLPKQEKLLTMSDVQQSAEGSAAIATKVAVPCGKQMTVYPALEIDAELYTQTMLTVCADTYQYTIIDLPHSVAAPHVVQALKRADVIIIRDYFPADPSELVCRTKTVLEKFELKKGVRLLYALSNGPVTGGVPHSWLLAVLMLLYIVLSSVAMTYLMTSIIVQTHYDLITSYSLMLVLFVLAVLIPVSAFQTIMLSRRARSTKIIKQQQDVRLVAIPYNSKFVRQALVTPTLTNIRFDKSIRALSVIIRESLQAQRLEGRTVSNSMLTDDRS